MRASFSSFMAVRSLSFVSIRASSSTSSTCTTRGRTPPCSAATRPRSARWVSANLPRRPGKSSAASTTTSRWVLRGLVAMPASATSACWVRSAHRPIRAASTWPARAGSSASSSGAASRDGGAAKSCSAATPTQRASRVRALASWTSISRSRLSICATAERAANTSACATSTAFWPGFLVTVSVTAGCTAPPRFTTKVEVHGAVGALHHAARRRVAGPRAGATGK